MTRLKYIRKIDLLTLFFPSICLCFLLGCKKMIEVDAPVTSVNEGTVYREDATAAAVLTNIYSEMSYQNSAVANVNLSTMSWWLGLSADEIELYTGFSGLTEYYSNDLTPKNLYSFWNTIYPTIFIANSALEGISASNSLAPDIKRQLIGEAYFIRAFCYFYLVNMYGDVPLVLTTNWQTNALMANTHKAVVYKQIILDLLEAKSMLSEKYLKSDIKNVYDAGLEERLRPTKWAAAALLARVYLYNADYVNAEAEASFVINNNTYFELLSDLSSVYLKNSREAIWQLQPVRSGTRSNTGDGMAFILPSSGPSSYPRILYMNKALVNDFEVGDRRRYGPKRWVDSVKANSVTYYYPFKYKIGSVNTTTKEYLMVLRVAEQFLIRAESRVRQNKLSDAISDLDRIRNRSGLPLIAATNPTISQNALLEAIIHERKVELFTEWGHRWFDLKRIGKIDEVMKVITPQKSIGRSWQSYFALFPIPQEDINKNSNLVQNSGY